MGSNSKVLVKILTNDDYKDDFPELSGPNSKQFVALISLAYQHLRLLMQPRVHCRCQAQIATKPQPSAHHNAAVTLIMLQSDQVKP